MCGEFGNFSSIMLTCTVCTVHSLNVWSGESKLVLVIAEGDVQMPESNKSLQYKVPVEGFVT